MILVVYKPQVSYFMRIGNTSFRPKKSGARLYSLSIMSTLLFIQQTEVHHFDNYYRLISG